MSSVKKSIVWEVDVNLLKNNVIVKQTVFALGLPGLMVFLIVLIISGGRIFNIYSLYAFIFISVFLFLSLFFILIAYKGKYSAGYVVNSKGILNYSQKSHLRKGLLIGRLTFILGLLMRKPSTAGAGVLSASRHSVLLKWNEIKKIKEYPGSYTIIVIGGFAQRIGVFCTEENYSQVLSYIKAKLEEQ
jgi:hypothetical protein